MNLTTTNVEVPSCRLSEAGRARLLSRRGEPLLLAGWERLLFLHFEVEAEVLQRVVPFPLDLYEGKAHVSLVAFTMRGMRPRFGGPLMAGLFQPVATHHFLNVRTYVRNGNEPGIYFITEWLSNWLSVQLGPRFYGLPYRHANINYQHTHEKGALSGVVQTGNDPKRFAYEAQISPEVNFSPCPHDTRDEFLLERYTAYTARGPTRRFFRIWHPPWRQAPVHVSILDDTLLTETFPWFKPAKYLGANYAPGFAEVWMGRAQRVCGG